MKLAELILEFVNEHHSNESRFITKAEMKTLRRATGQLGRMLAGSRRVRRTGAIALAVIAVGVTAIVVRRVVEHREARADGTDLPA